MALSNEAIVAIGWFVGQFAVTAIAVGVLQAKLKIEKNYFKVAVIYFKEETGNIVIAFAGLLVMLFIFPDFWDSDINRMDLKIKSTLTWKERIMFYQRFTTVVVGGLIQLILILGYRKGVKAVEKYFT